MVENTGATDRAGAIRTLKQPIDLVVKADDEGFPKALTLRGRWVEVETVSDTWRIDDEWWREHPISRMYFQCVVHKGMKVAVYQDLVSDKWYLQPV